MTAVAGGLKAGQVIEPIPDQRKLHEDLQYSEGQQAAQEAEAEMLKALASSNAAEHLAAMELLNASQTVSSFVSHQVCMEHQSCVLSRLLCYWNTQTVGCSVSTTK